jgi:hypothetical protein
MLIRIKNQQKDDNFITKNSVILQVGTQPKGRTKHIKGGHCAVFYYAVR